MGSLRIDLDREAERMERAEQDSERALTLSELYDDAFLAVAPFDGEDIYYMEQAAEERWAEDAWLRHAEYYPQAQEDL